MSEGFAPKEVRELLFTAAKIVPPSFRVSEGELKLDARQKIDLVEDHILLIARWRAKVEEAMLYLQAALKELEDEWDGVEGWQNFRGDRETSQKSITEAKRKVRPDLYDSIREAKWLIDKCLRQIRRLERDEEFSCSRVYTFVTGG